VASRVNGARASRQVSGRTAPIVQQDPKMATSRSVAYFASLSPPTPPTPPTPHPAPSHQQIYKPPTITTPTPKRPEVAQRALVAGNPPPDTAGGGGVGPRSPARSFENSCSTTHGRAPLLPLIANAG
jgi:hypothetical protein